LVSVIEKGKPILLPIDGSNLLPSVVSYPDSKTVLVGRPALDARPQYPENTFSSIKRIIGRKLDDAMKSGDNYLFGKRLRSIKAEDNEEYCGVYCSSLKKVLLPEQISADILRRLIKRAENYYRGEKVTNAVITVPEYFTSAQRDATIRAGKLAGLDKIKVLGEPEAAAIAYGLRQKSPQLVLVFDLGGGTFDVSVLEVGAGLVEVISTNGDK
jgi:molecular chaperone DnaK